MATPAIEILRNSGYGRRGASSQYSKYYQNQGAMWLLFLALQFLAIYLDYFLGFIILPFPYFNPRPTPEQGAYG